MQEFSGSEHKGIWCKSSGSFIIDTLETDELFLRAERIEIPASITAVDFYRKKGYEYKNGIKEPDEENLYRLEKFREIRTSKIVLSKQQ